MSKLFNRLLAFVWLVVIGSNGAQYYSQEAPFEGLLIVAGAAYFIAIWHRDLLQLLAFKNFFLVLALFVVPLLLIFFSERIYERTAYTSQISLLLVFLVAALLALQSELKSTLLLTSFVLVLVATLLNLYELFVENNLWSVAPGRSAGFYVNPNITGEALLGYGLFFLMGRNGKLRIADLAIMALIIVGQFTTFSRAGILTSLILLLAAALMRVERKDFGRLIFGGVAIACLTATFAALVLANVDLSEDAEKRINSLLGAGGVGDYEQDRGAAAADALEIIDKYPLGGAGFNAANEMDEGPHNMFLAVTVDYGIGGLLVYLLLILMLIQSAHSVDSELSAPIWLFVGWLIIFSFASHNLLGNNSTIPLLGFILARVYQIRLLRRELQIGQAVLLERMLCEF